MSRYPEILLSYEDYISNTKRLTESTVKEYLLDLSLFFRFTLVHSKHKKNNKGNFKEYPELLEQENILELSLEDVTSVSWSSIQDFLAYYVGFLNNSERSQKRKLVSIRRFYDYLLLTGQISANPVADIEIRTPKKQPVSLSEDEILNKLLPIIEDYEGQYKERNKCIMILFLELGIRLSELVNIDLDDIKDGNILIKGKGKKERLLPLNSICLNAIDDYLSTRPKSIEIKDGHKNALFISRMKRRISTRTVQLIVDEFLEAANLNSKDKKKYTTHKLRHTFATLLADKGVSVHDIQEFLGHESLSTTSVYVNSKFKRLRAIKDEYPILKKSND